MSDLARGGRLGGYELGGPIQEQGGVGVYRARSGTGEELVMRIVLPSEAGGGRPVETYRRRAAAAVRLRHPNVAATTDFGEDRGAFFVVSEDVPGTTVGALVRQRGRLRPHEAADIAGGVAAALVEAHAGGVIHGSIDCEVVVVGPRGHVRLTGFGLPPEVGRNGSRRQEQAGRESGAPSPPSLLGADAYRAPEVIAGNDPDQRSDIFSVGVLLCHMLTGNTLLCGGGAYSEDGGLGPASVNPDVPPELNEIALRAQHPHPSRRFADAGELLDALNRFHGRQLEGLIWGGRSPVQPVPQSRPKQAPPATPVARLLPRSYSSHRKRRRAQRIQRRVAVAVVMVAAVALVAWLAAGRTPDTAGPGRGGRERSAAEAKGSREGTRRVAVPDLTGKSRAAAVTSLEKAGLKAGKIKTRDSDRVAPGRVVDQSVAGGRKAKAGSAIDLVLAA